MNRGGSPELQQETGAMLSKRSTLAILGVWESVVASLELMWHEGRGPKDVMPAWPQLRLRRRSCGAADSAGKYRAGVRVEETGQLGAGWAGTLEQSEELCPLNF
eukprot:EG_transcript_45855